jgi:hypothetical protein
MTTPLTLTVFNPPYGIDQTATRMWLRGKALFAPGSYVAGGLQPTSGWNPLAQANGENVLIPTYTTPTALAITNSALTSNVATITATNALVAGQYVTFAGLTNAPFLNGLTLIVASAGSTSFTVAYTHANVTSAAETGNATIVIGPDDMILTSQSGSGYLYQYNKANATIQILTTGTASGDGLNELAAGALPSGVTGDVINWVATYCKA